MRISDWSSDVCSSDLAAAPAVARRLRFDPHPLADFPKETEIMNRRIGVVATLVFSALAFTGGAILYSGTAEGEPTKKVVAGPVYSLIPPHSPIISPNNSPVNIVSFFHPSCKACLASYPTDRKTP